MMAENTISKAKNILVMLPGIDYESKELRYLIENFCGTVVTHFSEIQGDLSAKRIYVCGNFENLENIDTPFYIIKELSDNHENCTNENIQIITLGKVPVVVSNAGVYFRQFFDEDDYFHKITTEHEFQHLTESNKPGTALRKGIYLTEVSKEPSEKQNEILHFQLLRCSSNLSGPSDNFRDTDRKIITAINDAARCVFEIGTNINHVLAQVYENKKMPDKGGREVKAKISAHSDKTKDMPQEALIAFCTFYDKANFKGLSLSKADAYDWCYNETSALTQLHFKLKNSVSDETLEKEFSVTLYPNSVFFIPLSTNRLYTHEIKPSLLNIDRTPTRLGYVARCSNAEAVYMNEQTFIVENGALIKLEEMTEEMMSDLKSTYKEENQTASRIKYDKVHFSMNKGDYQKPIY